MQPLPGASGAAGGGASGVGGWGGPDGIKASERSMHQQIRKSEARMEVYIYKYFLPLLADVKTAWNRLECNTFGKKRKTIQFWQRYLISNQRQP